MGRLIGVIRLLVIVFGAEVFMLLLMFTGPALLAENDLDPAATQVAWIPLVRNDPTPTPVPTPVLPPSPYEAHLQITPTGGIRASTYNRDSFILRNHSPNEQRIALVRIDLSTAVFPDMVFDPYGQGGDNLAKDLKVDNDGNTDFKDHRYEGEHGGGYDILILEFESFDKGREFRFSVDVDPNSIRYVGAPGPNEAGSVSGLELMGSTVTVVFEDGKELVNQTFRMPGSESGSEVFLREGLPPAPQLSVHRLVSTPATVSDANQTALIAEPNGQPTTLLVLEGGLFLDGVPGGGYNVEPYDANSLVAISEYTIQTDYSAQVSIPITLFASSPEAGINHLAAAFDNHYGAKGATSATIKLQLSQ